MITQRSNSILIKQRRVMNLQKHLSFVEEEKKVVIGLADPARFEDKLVRAGFSPGLPLGESVLPAPDFGPRSRYNAEGEYIKHKDQPMETAYRQQDWHWIEWHGRDRIERSKIVDVPYKRYPREFMPPPSVELHVGTDADGSKIVYTSAVRFMEDNYSLIKHIINLYLEMFRKCEVLTENLEPFATPVAEVKRLNWEVLPPGKWPWEKLRERVEPVLKRARRGNRPVIRHRLRAVSRYEPEFVAVGRAGFRGYLIFGFPELDLFVCESAYYGNATYVFGQDWETLSQMTKAQILNGDLQKDRIIHRENWDLHLRRLFRQAEEG